MNPITILILAALFFAIAATLFVAAFNAAERLSGMADGGDGDGLA